MKKKRILVGIAVGVILMVVVAVGYLNDGYKATEAAQMAMISDDDVTVEQIDGAAVFMPAEPVDGMIFYPGGKVEYTAYEPLMRECAQKGILCVLTKMPLNLAVLDVSAAEGICEKYEGIDKWYIGGHSLGGSMAASYLADNRDNFEGLVLLGSYSTADLSEGDVDVLSVFGSEDKVMNREKYEKYKGNLPDDFTEYVLEGGNHAFIGMYGEQDGDSKGTMTNEEQIKLTAQKIAELIG